MTTSLSTSSHRPVYNGEDVPHTVVRRVNRYFGIINLGAGALLVLMGMMVYAGTFVRLTTLFRPAI